MITDGVRVYPLRRVLISPRWSIRTSVFCRRESVAGEFFTLPSEACELRVVLVAPRPIIMKTHLRITPFFHRILAVTKYLCLLCVGALMFGCPASKPSGDSSGGGATATPSATNTVVIRGSNTIGEELAPRLIAEFKKAHPVTAFDLDTKATGYGMAALRIGQCDIAAASRAAIQADLDLAKESGIEMNDHVLGLYSVAVVVNANNPVANLTKEQVHDIFTGKIANWKDVGGADAEIHLYVRDPISGTHLGFKEVAMNNDAYAAHFKLLTAYSAIAESVGKDAGGIGYSSINHANTSGAKAVSIEGVEASAAAVHGGKYPYARTLRFYTNKARESDAAKEFVQFVLSTRGQEIVSEMGFTTKP
ncbi:MAG: phosphate ABC transporter substrate-binding protein [Verrucomicrobiales bacterium]|nr:MAG: phosphate ABC transporter substrate-binding protein [Verrucomicrobiales bacterium]